MKFTKTARITAWVLFSLYAAVMIYLLFIQRLINCGFDITVYAYPDYGQALLARLEPVPFRTIAEFIGRVEALSVSDLAFRNLVGNVVLFVPIGLFLPVLFRRQRRFPAFLTTTVITICAVELTQMLTLLGSCDIDDLILNTAGACTGFAVYKLSALLIAKKQDRLRTAPPEHTEH